MTCYIKYYATVAHFKFLAALFGFAQAFAVITILILCPLVEHIALFYI
jgi:hypothetical protein